MPTKKQPLSEYDANNALTAATAKLAKHVYTFADAPDWESALLVAAALIDQLCVDGPRGGGVAITEAFDEVAKLSALRDSHLGTGPIPRAHQKALA